ncbi:hypothetical protein MKY30_13200 [Oceanobacillus sp. FSL W8-0428]|uniref:hypothetical protein n=1 Tax=Oceanobacillus TaxID=182709 RepID=UPI0012EEB300
MEDTKNAKKRNPFDYALILLAIIGFASLFLYPDFMDVYFSPILLSIGALAFFTRLVVLVKNKTFGLHFIVFFLLTIVTIYFLYDLV